MTILALKPWMNGVISNLSADQVHQKLRTLCDQKADGFDNSVPVFGSYDRKYFYGKITDHQFSLRRTSRFSRNSYRIDGSFKLTNDAKTEITYELNYDKNHYWGLRLVPLLAWLLVDPILYFNSDIPLEGIIYINLFSVLD
jgi:hypothetical protein